MCTGFDSGLQFSNCISGPGKSYVGTPSPQGPFASNSTFAGYASGAGPGSATVGKNYTVTIVAVFVDGTSYNETSSVQAVKAD